MRGDVGFFMVIVGIDLLAPLGMGGDDDPGDGLRRIVRTGQTDFLALQRDEAAAAVLVAAGPLEELRVIRAGGVAAA